MARTITAEETEVVVTSWSAARAGRDAGHRRLRPGDRRSAVPRVAWAGGNEQTAIRLANMSVDESGMGKREPTRRAKVLGILRDALRQKSIGVIEEDPAQGHREVRQAGRRDRVADSGDQPLRDAGRHRHLRDQVQGRGDLLAAPVEPQDDHRNRAPDARGARETGRAGRHPAGRRAPEHPAGQRADGDLRPDDRDRRPGDGQGRLRLGQARLRRRRRQCHDGDRRDRRTSRKRRATPASARPTTTARAARPTATCSSTRRIYDAFLAQLQKEGGYLVADETRRTSCRRPTGTARDAAPPTRSRARRR